LRLDVVDTARLVKIQKQLEKLVLQSIEHRRRKTSDYTYCLGLDAAYSRRYGGIGVAVLLDKEKRVVDRGVAVGEPGIPYIPGLLAFREAPILYAAAYPLLERLTQKAMIIFVDGHGVSHPRHTGIASHIGLALAAPSIGVAKKRLYGREVRYADDCAPKPCILGHLEDNEMKLAAIIKTYTGSSIYVSPGAHISYVEAVRITLQCLERRPLPEPTYIADKLSKRIARDLDKGRITPASLKRGVTSYL